MKRLLERLMNSDAMVDVAYFLVCCVALCLYPFFLIVLRFNKNAREGMGIISDRAKDE